jgi:hypothetical protein
MDTAEKSAVVEGILSATMYEHDPTWALEICLKYCNAGDVDIRGIAIEGLGHIARVHGDIDLERVIPVLDVALKDTDPWVVDKAEFSLDDLTRFVPTFAAAWKTRTNHGTERNTEEEK